MYKILGLLVVLGLLNINALNAQETISCVIQTNNKIVTLSTPTSSVSGMSNVKGCPAGIVTDGSSVYWLKFVETKASFDKTKYAEYTCIYNEDTFGAGEGHYKCKPLAQSEKIK